jgi:hypothetical protein
VQQNVVAIVAVRDPITPPPIGAHVPATSPTFATMSPLPSRLMQPAAVADVGVQFDVVPPSPTIAVHEALGSPHWQAPHARVSETSPNATRRFGYASGQLGCTPLCHMQTDWKPGSMLGTHTLPAPQLAVAGAATSHASSTPSQDTGAIPAEVAVHDPIEDGGGMLTVIDAATAMMGLHVLVSDWVIPRSVAQLASSK